MNRGITSRHIRGIIWIVFLLTVSSSVIYGQVPVKTQVDSLLLKGEEGEKGEKEGKMGEEGEKGEDRGKLGEMGGADTINNDLVSNKKTKIEKETIPFKPKPKTAAIAATIFPGLGQIYNRQYWKLPIVYGGLMGCLYAVTWNNKTYADYKEAYFSIMKDSKADPQAEHPEDWSDRWQVFIPGNIDPATRLHDVNFQNNLKRGKDYFRRYRELSWIIMVAVYGITIADAYVDAQMFDFDVSPDLSLHVTPLFLPETLYHSRSYGITICMNF